MRAAFNEGSTVAPAAAVTDIVRYDGSWWLFDRDSWLRFTDADLAADLDAFSARSAGRGCCGPSLEDRVLSHVATKSGGTGRTLDVRPLV